MILASTYINHKHIECWNGMQSPLIAHWFGEGRRTECLIGQVAQLVCPLSDCWFSELIKQAIDCRQHTMDAIVCKHVEYVRVQ